MTAKWKLALLGAGMIALGAAVGVLTSRHYDVEPVSSPVEGMLWPQPKVLGPFSVTDHDGEPFGLDDLEGRWSFMFFGYTHCPDICPITMSVLDQVQKDVAAADDIPVQTVFVSVDPERDTPERLAEYVHHFNPEFIGLGGSMQQIQGLTAQIGVAFYHEQPTEGGGYLVDHNASVFLTDPQGRLVSIFSAPHSPESMAAKFRRIRAFLRENRA